MKGRAVKADTQRISPGLWHADAAHCIGMDEVGRGALAGPLVAAAVTLPLHLSLPDGLALADSKCLVAAHREALDAWIRTHAGIVLVEAIGVAAINRLGIGWANRVVFQRLMARIGPGQYFVDGNLRLRGLSPGRCRVICLCDGDARHATVAAASIVAKVYRDNLMQNLHQTYPRYGWATNAGYATAEHRAAVLDMGPCVHHRTLFLRRVLEVGEN